MYVSIAERKSPASDKLADVFMAPAVAGCGKVACLSNGKPPPTGGNHIGNRRDGVEGHAGLDECADELREALEDKP